MMTTLLDRLSEDEGVARAATPGEWRVDRTVAFLDTPFKFRVRAPSEPITDNYLREGDATFIARFNPEYVLRLIEVVRTASVLADEAVHDECLEDLALPVCQALQALAEHGATP